MVIINTQSNFRDCRNNYKATFPLTVVYIPKLKKVALVDWRLMFGFVHSLILAHSGRILLLGGRALCARRPSLPQMQIRSAAIPEPWYRE